ncbi:Uncharacterised protein [Streptococcus agalactiae]|nr:Uncharacterised protein [Streptococcus agalactiae]
MVGLGTVINVILIIVGGFVGLFLKNFFERITSKEPYASHGSCSFIYFDIRCFGENDVSRKVTSHL